MDDKSPLASGTKKHGKSHHGYKLSISADRKYKLICQRHISTAKQHDSNHFDDVLDPTNTSRDVWADKGYEDKVREQRLPGKRAGVCTSSTKLGKVKPQFGCQKRRNTNISRPRARVEPVFGAMLAIGGKVVRSIELARAKFVLSIKAVLVY